MRFAKRREQSVQAFVLVVALMVIGVNLAVEAVNLQLNPRMRHA